MTEHIGRYTGNAIGTYQNTNVYTLFTLIDAGLVGIGNKISLGIAIT